MSKTREEILDEAERLLLRQFIDGAMTLDYALRSLTMVEASLDAADEMDIPYGIALWMTASGLESGELVLGADEEE